MRRLAQLIARAAGALSRRLGRGGGTSLPGVVLLELRPNAAAELAAGLDDGVLLLSATNGKTTTARFIAAAMRADGRRFVANPAGANLLRGVTTALLDASTERPPPTSALFEVDEAALPEVVRQLEPRVIVLMNLYRDQLDRYGELETLAETWSSMLAVATPATVVVNADDPTLAHLGAELLEAERHQVVYFGVDDTRSALDELPHAADATHCRHCGEPLFYDVVLLGHLGHWHCATCGRRRPRPAVSAERVDIHGVDGSTIEIATPTGPITAELTIPGLHNAYNATAAVAASLAFGVDPGRLGPALASVDAAFGRSERLQIDGRELVLLLAKNPTGVNENIRTVLLDDGPLHLLVSLNDRTADGQDISWIWDVDHEPLFDRVASLTLSGIRADDLALRFKYGGLELDRFTVEADVAAGLDHALGRLPDGGTLYALPTYTAMLDLRAELVRRGVAGDFWKDE